MDEFRQGTWGSLGLWFPNTQRFPPVQKALNDNVRVSMTITSFHPKFLTTILGTKRPHVWPGNEKDARHVPGEQNELPTAKQHHR